MNRLVLAGLALGLSIAPGHARAAGILPIQKLFEQARRAPDIAGAAGILETALRDRPEDLRFSERQPIWKGVDQLAGSFRAGAAELAVLEPPIHRLYQVYLERHPEGALYGRDLATVIRLRPADSVEETLRTLGPRTTFARESHFHSDPHPDGSATVRILRHLVAGKLPAPRLLKAFEWLALASTGGQERRVDARIGSYIDEVLSELPAPLQVAGLRRVVYDLGWYLGGDRRHGDVNPEVALKWIRRVLADLDDPADLHLAADLLGQVGGHFDPYDDRARDQEPRERRVPQDFLPGLAAAVPAAQLLPLLRTASHRLDLDAGAFRYEETITAMVEATRDNGGDAATLEELEAYLREPRVQAPREEPSLADALRRFAGWKVGREVTGEAAEGEFRLVYRDARYPFIGSGCTSRWDLQVYQGGSWRGVAVVTSDCRSKSEFDIQFRLGWKFRKLVSGGLAG